MLHNIARLRPMLVAIGVGAINQAISSGTTFAFGLYLVRELAPRDFGLYGISFSCVLFFGGFCGSLFSLQMALKSPLFSEDGSRSFQANVFMLLAVFCVLVIAVLTTLQLLAPLASSSWGTYASLAWATLAASIAYAAKEYVVRVAYVRYREGDVLKVHIVLCATLPLWLALFTRGFSRPAELETAVWSYALAHVCAFMSVASRVAPKPFGFRTLKRMIVDWREILPGGRWAALSFIAYFLRVQAHTLIASTLNGPAGLAALNAARIYVTPAMLLTPAMSQVILARMASGAQTGQMSVVNGSLAACSLLLSIAIGYGALLWATYEIVAPFVTSSQYPNVSNLVTLWMIYGCVLAIRNSAEMGVQVLMRQRLLALFNSVTMLVTLGAVLTLSLVLQLEGAIVGLIAGEALLAVLLWIVVLRGRPSP